MSEELQDYFFTSTMDVGYIDLVEITHPNFTETYRLVRNYSLDNGGITVNLSAEEQGAFFTFRPIQLTPLSSRDDPESSISVQLGDVGEIISREMEFVGASDGFQTKPTMRYWAYRSDELGAPMYGPVELEIKDVEINQDGASFEAHAPFLNETATGELYTLDRFPMLRGYV